MTAFYKNSSDPLISCHLCPRSCGINRRTGQVGFCGIDDRIHISWAGLHHGEEPCLSGTNGVANVFFSSCNLACVFCQNHQISQQNFCDTPYSPEAFSDLLFKLEDSSPHFVGLVTPTPQIPQIRQGLIHAKKHGFKTPVIYNSSAYESVEAVKSMDGLVDVYLPDMKYGDNACAKTYSHALSYVETAQNALLEMFRQKGALVLDKNTGLARKGVIVRHLVLPENVSRTWECLCFVALEMSTDVGVSLMSQYSPLHHAADFPEINRKITCQEYDKALAMARDLGFEIVYTQDMESSPDNAIPDFTDADNPFCSF